MEDLRVAGTVLFKNVEQVFSACCLPGATLGSLRCPPGCSWVLWRGCFGWAHGHMGHAFSEGHICSTQQPGELGPACCLSLLWALGGF